MGKLRKYKKQIKELQTRAWGWFHAWQEAIQPTVDLEVRVLELEERLGELTALEEIHENW